MGQLKRGDKIYLDENKMQGSTVNTFLDCRDGIVEVCEYKDESGYGSKTRLFLFKDAKHESVSIIRQIYIDFEKRWVEQDMDFNSDSFEFLKAIINGEKNALGGKYTLVRNY